MRATLAGPRSPCPKLGLLALGLALGALGVGCEEPLALVDAAGSDGGGLFDAGVPEDAGGRLDAGAPDGGAPLVDAGGADGGAPRVDAGPPPSEVFFVGNSFTFGGPVPDLVRDLAVYAGFPEPNVEYRAIGGQTLAGHRADSDPAGAPARVAEGWDVLVLQEFSTRPTDQVGPAMQFKEDATWFYDLAKAANEDCEIVLYETWARRAGHPIYRSTFTDPAEMQAELRFHYNDAADRYIPMFSAAARPRDVRVAPAGDAWERQLAGGEPPVLHASDDYHASAAGAYLNALVIYSTIWRRSADGLVPLRGLDEATATTLQASADAVTGQTGRGPVLRPRPMPVGAQVQVDLGPRMVTGWAWLAGTDRTVGPLSAGAEPTSVLATAWSFSGVQEGGPATNLAGLPADVGVDTLWVGSFGGHAAALREEARVVLRGLAPGRYRLTLFASRNGDDGGRGRLTRYAVGADFTDLEASDNQDRLATLDVAPDADGEVLLRIGVSPDGTARFAYLGALIVERLE